MEDNALNEKKVVGRAKSYNSGPSMKLKAEPAKRKSLNVNEAVRSLDLALGRLKKSKLVDGEYNCNTTHTSPVRHSIESAHMFIDSLTEPGSNYNHGTDSASAMSMNFSHYELMRNLSRSNCNSDGAFSSTTCNSYISASDATSKREHLERYFRSVDMWNRNCEGSGVNDASPDMQEK